MARVVTCGWETGAVAEASSGTSVGAAAVDSTNQSQGNYCLKLTSGALANVSFATGAILGRKISVRFLFKFNQAPATTGFVAGFSGGLTPTTDVSTGLALNTSNRLRWINAGSTVGSTSDVLATDTYHVIEIAATIGTGATDAFEIKVNGTSIYSATGLSLTDTVITSTFRCNLSSALGGSFIAYYDGLKINDDQGSSETGFPNDGALALLLPVAESSDGSWTKPGGGTTDTYTSVDNVPPVGVADSTSSAQAENQLRNPTANNAYAVALTDYTTAGVSGTVNGLHSIAVVAAPVSTGAKVGSLEGVSNPAISALSFGNYHSGTNAGTFPTGWKYVFGNYSSSPSVTLGTQPVIRLNITSGTASRIAMTCFMGMYVEYTASTGYTGTATGTFDITGAATGTSPRIATASGTIALTGASEGKVQNNGSATGSIAFTGAAEGSGLTATTGTAAGSFDLAGATDGAVKVQGSAAGSLDLTGAAIATNPIAVTGAGSLALTGGAAGKVAATAQCSGSLDLSGSAAGMVALRGTLSGALDLTGSATGVVPALGTASGSIAFTGTATGAVSAKGTAAGALDLTGTASATVPITAAATGELTLSGTATGSGVLTTVGTASGDIAFDGTATAAVVVQGSISGEISLSGASQATNPVKGASSGTFALGGAAAGTLAVSGAASGTFDLTGSAASSSGINAAASGSLGLDGSAQGAVAVHGDASGALDFTGSATGAVATNAVAGDATGAFDLDGASDGHVRIAAGAAGDLAITGVSVAGVVIGGVAVGLFDIDGDGIGTVRVPSAPSPARTANDNRPAREAGLTGGSRTASSPSHTRTKVTAVTARNATSIRHAR